MFTLLKTFPLPAAPPIVAAAPISLLAAITMGSTIRQIGILVQYVFGVVYMKHYYASSKNMLAALAKKS